MANIDLTGIIKAKDAYNYDHNAAWEFGTNWSNVASDFETFINKYLFPKINSTDLINTELGNRFNFLAKEMDYIGQFSEEYVIMDSVPVGMNLSKNEELMLKRNYPKIATKLYGSGVGRKQKFTLNNNDVRHNFQTLGDAVSYAVGVYRKAISDINAEEEREVKAMLIDYSLANTKDKRTVASIDELVSEVFHALLNLQNNSSLYNETNTASGGAIGRYTTVTDVNDVFILTTDRVKTQLLNTHVANSFNIDGLDITDKVISFDDLGGTYKLTKDVTIAEQETVNYFRSFNDYQIAIGDLLPKGTVFTFPLTGMTEFVASGSGKNYEEIKPAKPDLYAYIFDVNKIRYHRYTKNMLKNFENPEFEETTYWLHYHVSKAMSPFFNNILIQGA